MAKKCKHRQRLMVCLGRRAGNRSLYKAPADG